MPKIPRKPLPFPEASPNDASPANETAETTVTVNDGAAAMGDNNAVAGRQGVAVQGDVGGDIITGTVIVKNYLRRTGLVDEWYREAEKPYLQRVQKEFAQSLSKKPLDKIKDAVAQNPFAENAPAAIARLRAPSLAVSGRPWPSLAFPGLPGPRRGLEPSKTPEGLLDAFGHSRTT